MSAVMTILSERDAHRLTDRIKITVESIDNSLFKLRALLDEAQNSNAWQILGYKSWQAYLVDLFDRPLRLPTEKRREIVGYLSGEGLSQRAIAPLIGVDQKTVSNDLRREETSSPEPPVEHQHPVGAGAPVEEVAEPVASSPDGSATVNLATGEVTEPTVTEHTVTEKTRVVTGLDGKTYTQKPRVPKPVPTGADVQKLNADTESQALGRALMTLTGMKYPEHRNRIITEWWPAGNDSVPPDSRALFEPRAIRDIATWLMQLADDLEVAV